MTVGRVVVIGVGNPLRGDDAAGLLAVARIPPSPGVELIAHAGEGVDLLELWAGADAVVIADSAASGAEPGTIVSFDASDRPLPSALARSAGHATGVAEAIELARSLGRLPARVVVLGVEGADFTLGAALSEPVRVAIDALAEAAGDKARHLADQSITRRQNPRVPNQTSTPSAHGQDDQADTRGHDSTSTTPPTSAAVGPLRVSS